MDACTKALCARCGSSWKGSLARLIGQSPKESISCGQLPRPKRWDLALRGVKAWRPKASKSHRKSERRRRKLLAPLGRGVGGLGGVGGSPDMSHDHP